VNAELMVFAFRSERIQEWGECHLKSHPQTSRMSLAQTPPGFIQLITGFDEMLYFLIPEEFDAVCNLRCAYDRQID
jgi:hypothetical protein